MANNIQARSGKFQLRVTHKLLPKPFFFTFATEDQAKSYRDLLEMSLAVGVVPSELLAKPNLAVNDPLFTVIIGDYLRETPATDSDEILLSILRSEVLGVRLSRITFLWVEGFVRALKGPARNLAPSSIRKRVGALGRVLDWYILRNTQEGESARTNPLRMLPRGYSVYSKEDAKLATPKEDQIRNRRLSELEARQILQTLEGLKREDRERPYTNDPAFNLLYRVIVDTGLRLFEAYRLRTDSFDFRTNIINVDGSKGHRGRAKPRVVPLKKELREPLKEWCAARVGLIFPFWDGSEEGRKGAQMRLTQRFASLFAYSKVDDFSEHDLRHEAACRWFELRNDRGWVFSEIEVCRIMGWTDTRMALRYASLRGEDLSSRLG